LVEPEQWCINDAAAILSALLAARLPGDCLECGGVGVVADAWDIENFSACPIPGCSNGKVPGRPVIDVLAEITELPAVEARSVFTDEKIDGLEFFVRAREVRPAPQEENP
jgi:hypothetical protein